ncbi:hypothetical protein ACFX13_020661 [Malus domestica]|uniref:Ferredoxin thioredoxin reductase alpha chain domain-containing protein n=1 Tax=Malus domestica TaxID=3750 RepID=A0A498HG89_MALDO|nr:ferredoxin-thioredoxin reductase, variable chain-like [Malus domestica]XP_050130492.1 ferredoxin-thioredoxin reductase, variable chain-like [Malus sylvestris]RXH70476.1 hypothetical protein DVH24_007732 [Malus domestica]
MGIATVAAAAASSSLNSSLRAAADAGQLKSFSFSFPSCWAVSFPHHKLTPTALTHCPWRRKLSRRVICEVAAADVSPSTSSDEPAAAASSKIGARVRVKVPLKVYHVPRVPEVDITGMEGELKQYVGLWKGKRISANLPYKVQFVVDVQGRGAVKFFAHLKEDEFEYL